MERLAHLSPTELAQTRLLHYRDAASDLLSALTVTLGVLVLTLHAHCPLF